MSFCKVQSKSSFSCRVFISESFIMHLGLVHVKCLKASVKRTKTSPKHLNVLFNGQTGSAQKKPATETQQRTAKPELTSCKMTSESHPAIHQRSANDQLEINQSSDSQHWNKPQHLQICNNAAWEKDRLITACFSLKRLCQGCK